MVTLPPDRTASAPPRPLPPLDPGPPAAPRASLPVSVESRTATVPPAWSGVPPRRPEPRWAPVAPGAAGGPFVGEAPGAPPQAPVLVDNPAPWARAPGAGAGAPAAGQVVGDGAVDEREAGTAEIQRGG